ncbi:MAG: divalent-cation tolerance protein CutA [Chloroflexota bacterium]
MERAVSLLVEWLVGATLIDRIMETEFIIVLVTVPSQEIGRQIALSLLEKKLAACVNIVAGVQSLYIWQGKLCDEQEVLLIIKSRMALFASELVPAIQAIHPYEVPEIIALPLVHGSQDYLAWLSEMTHSK